MRRAALAAVLLLNPCLGSASDWKYAGYVGTTALDRQPSVAFYDADSLKRDGSSVRYWVKTIPEKTLDTYAGKPGTKKSKDFVEAAANKIASGYVPPLLTVQGMVEKHQGDLKDFLVAVVAWEVAANTGANHTTLFLYEIDCDRKAIRYLDATVFDGKGNVKARTGTLKKEWSFIAPDTNAAWTSEVMCPKSPRGEP